MLKITVDQNTQTASIEADDGTVTQLQGVALEITAGVAVDRQASLADGCTYYRGTCIIKLAGHPCDAPRLAAKVTRRPEPAPNLPVRVVELGPMRNPSDKISFELQASSPDVQIENPDFWR